MEDIFSKWEEIKQKTKKEYDMTEAAYRVFILPLTIKSVNNDVIQVMIPFEQDQGTSIVYYNKYIRSQFR